MVVNGFPYNFHSMKKQFSHREFTGKLCTPFTEKSKKVTYILDIKKEKAAFDGKRTRHYSQGVRL